MPEMIVKAVLPADKTGTDEPRPCEVAYDFGGNVEEMIELFGDQVVYANARAQMVIGLQAMMRRAMMPDKEGKTKTDDEISAMAKEWTPGDRTVTRKTAVEKAKDLLGGMSPEEKAELLASLKGA